MTGRDRKHPLRIVVKRLCILFFALYVTSFGLWIAGNDRSYLDSTQSLLLRFLGFDGIVLAFFSVVGLLCVLILPSGRPRNASRIATGALGVLGYLCFLALAILGILFGSALSVVSTGLG